MPLIEHRQPFTFVKNQHDMGSSFMRLLRHFIAAAAAAALFWGCAAIDGADRSGAGQTALSDRSENAYFYYTEAQLAQQNGDREKAVHLLRKAVELDPTSVYLKRELAVEYIHQKDLQNALAVVEEILKSHPDDVETLIVYGRIKQGQNQLDQAGQAYEKVIALDKNQQEIYLLLGGIYLQKEQYDDALRIFKELVHNFPNAYTGHFFLGKIYARKRLKRNSKRPWR
jgi:predicted Zn-dependent protease